MTMDEWSEYMHTKLAQLRRRLGEAAALLETPDRLEDKEIELLEAARNDLLAQIADVEYSLRNSDI